MGCTSCPRRQVEDEFVYQNSFRLNVPFYTSLGEKRAFVLSHGRHLLDPEDRGLCRAGGGLLPTGWIYRPTSGSPTSGIRPKGGCGIPVARTLSSASTTALVHNGDFANYHAVATYLSSATSSPVPDGHRGERCSSSTCWTGVYGYPLEMIIEALAPTTERDFELLAPEKQRLYRASRRPTSTARPTGRGFSSSPEPPGREQFATHGHHRHIHAPSPGLCPARRQGADRAGRSEKQAIDATLESLAAEDERICPVADRYWNARGGSATDGRLLYLLLEPCAGLRVSCHDKFGKPKTVPLAQRLGLARRWHGSAARMRRCAGDRRHLETGSGWRLFEAVNVQSASVLRHLREELRGDRDQAKRAALKARPSTA